jgi:phage baseplate assembly protein W
MSGISPKLPLANNKVDGAYELNKTIKQSVNQNLKNLILTNPGERIMDPLFGVGLSQILV